MFRYPIFKPFCILDHGADEYLASGRSAGLATCLRESEQLAMMMPGASVNLIVDRSPAQGPAGFVSVGQSLSNASTAP
jgi:hypothetical protein